MPMILKALMGDDYDKIPDWVKDRNLIIPTGNGTYATIPMPYGYSWFYSAGMISSDAIGKSQDPMYGPGGAASWATLRMTDAFMNNWAPTGGSNSLATLLLPTLADPIYELASNTDWTGRPIMPSAGFNDTDRTSQRFWGNTNPAYVAAADAMSRATGGYGRMPGLIEVSPNTIEYATDWVFGGLGKFVNQSVTLATGNADSINDVPIVRSFVGDANSAVYTSSNYSEIQNRVKRVEQSLAEAKAAGNTRLIDRLESRNAFEIEAMGVFKRAQRDISKQQSKRRAIERRYRENSSPMTDEDKQKIENVRDEIGQIKSRAIEESNELRN